jgi:hypothetical protein
VVGFICPGDTVVARTVADDFRDFVLFGDRLREHRAAPTPGNARTILPQPKKGRSAVRANHRHWLLS